MRLVQRELRGTMIAALFRERIRTRSWVASETLEMIMDCISSQ